MKRYDIVKGDTTMQGGDGQDILHDREQAYELDPVWCPVCKTLGVIECDGPRHSSTGPDGRQSALSDDICRCACPAPPKLVASQSVSYVDV